MKTVVRPARIEEASLIGKFQIQMAKESEDLALDEDTVSQGVISVFEKPEKGKYWVAECFGEIVGSMLVLSEWSDWRNGEVLWIHSVYVVPIFRGQGVFRSMYGHLKGLVLGSEGLVGLRLYVDKNNLVAQRVYENLGMHSDHYSLFEWLK